MQRVIQLMKNRFYDLGVKRTAYKAHYGCKIKVDLTASSVPKDVLKHVQRGENLEKTSDSIETAEQGDADSHVGDTGLTDANLQQLRKSSAVRNNQCSCTSGLWPKCSLFCGYIILYGEDN